MDEFGSKYCDFPGVEKWRYELLVSSFVTMLDNLETFLDEYKDSDSIRKSVEEWRLSAQQAQAATRAATKKQSLGLLEQAQWSIMNQTGFPFHDMSCSALASTVVIDISFSFS